MKSDSEYKRTLYEKYDKIQLERKITRKSLLISLSSTAVCLLLIVVFVASPMSGIFGVNNNDKYPTKITICEGNNILRSYTDEKTVSEVNALLDRLTFSAAKSEHLEDGILQYVVTRYYANGNKEVLYRTEKNVVTLSSLTPKPPTSIADIIKKYN